VIKNSRPFLVGILMQLLLAVLKCLRIIKIVDGSLWTWGTVFGDKFGEVPHGKGIASPIKVNISNIKTAYGGYLMTVALDSNTFCF
jgi:hypothetical protein